MAHITGGGLLENVHRMFPADTVAQIDSKAWQRPAIFSWLQARGNVAESEMQRTFNCGIGMVVVVAGEDVDRATALLAADGETVIRIGAVRAAAAMKRRPRSAEGRGNFGPPDDRRSDEHRRPHLRSRQATWRRCSKRISAARSLP